MNDEYFKLILRKKIKEISGILNDIMLLMQTPDHEKINVDFDDFKKRIKIWITEQIRFSDNFRISRKKLYENYEVFRKQNKLNYFGSHSFYKFVRNLGFKELKSNGFVYFII